MPSENFSRSAMLLIQILLLLTSCVIVGAAILEKVGEADLDAVRIRLEDEKAKRLLLENDVEVLMIKVEELKRGFSKISENDKVSVSPGNVTSLTAGIAFTATLSIETVIAAGQTVIFDNVKLNEGNCYNSSTGRFRAPFRGLYIFSVVVVISKRTGIHVSIMKDDGEIGRAYSGRGSTDSGSVTVVTVMKKGQEAYVRQTISATVTIHGDNWAHFTGLLHIRYT